MEEKGREERRGGMLSAADRQGENTAADGTNFGDIKESEGCICSLRKVNVLYRFWVRSQRFRRGGGPWRQNLSCLF